MQIVLDLQGAQTASRFRGIGRYSLALAKAIVANRGNHEVIIALNSLFPETIEPIRADFDSLLPQQNIQVWSAPGPVWDLDPANAARREVAERLREAFLASLEPDIVHISSLFEGYGDDAVTSIGEFASDMPTAVTLYDLIPLTSPDENRAFQEYYARKLRYFRRADLWLGISRFSCGEAVSLLQVDADRVVNLQGAADDRFRRIDLSQIERARIAKAYGLQKPFICWVGTPAEPRKNIAGLMQAFAQLPPELRSKFQILAIGRMEKGDVVALKRAVRRFALRPNEVVFPGYVSDGDLPRLYNMCHAFVLPSFSEGFGLPVLEAMQCGAPVIASNLSSIPEVVEFDEAMFDPYSADDLTHKLRRVLSDDEFRSTLISHHLRQATRFSWNESANSAIKAFEGLHELTKTRPWTSTTSYADLIASTAQVLKDVLNKSAAISTAMAIAQNHPEPRGESVLFVDVSELTQRDARSGVQRVTRSILKQLLDRPPQGYKVEPVYATVDNFGYRYARQFTREILGYGQFAEPDTIIEFRSGDVFFGLDLQHHVVIGHRDFYCRMRNQGVKVYFLVYDLLPIQFPRYFHRSLSEAHQRWLAVTSESDGVVCISRTVADQYIQWLSTSAISRPWPFHIGWFHLGADNADFPATRRLPHDADKVLSALTLAPSFLMVGTIEPRKGYAQTLAAFERLWAQGHNLRLVIVGKRGWMVDQLVKKLSRHHELGARLFWLENASDQYLQKIYATCTCLIAASEGEGYGLPLIEAAQQKLPIIARDIPVFREVAGNHATFFHGSEPEKLAHTISEWLALQSASLHPTTEGMPWLSWKQSAERLRAIILGGDWYAVWRDEGRRLERHHERTDVHTVRDRDLALQSE